MGVVQWTNTVQILLSDVSLSTFPVLRRLAQNMNSSQARRQCLKLLFQNDVLFGFISKHKNQFNCLLLHAGDFQDCLKNGRYSAASSDEEQSIDLSQLSICVKSISTDCNVASVLILESSERALNVQFSSDLQILQYRCQLPSLGKIGVHVWAINFNQEVDLRLCIDLMYCLRARTDRGVLSDNQFPIRIFFSFNLLVNPEMLAYLECDGVCEELDGKDIAIVVDGLLSHQLDLRLNRGHFESQDSYINQINIFLNGGYPKRQLTLIMSDHFFTLWSKCTLSLGSSFVSFILFSFRSKSSMGFTVSLQVLLGGFLLAHLFGVAGDIAFYHVGILLHFREWLACLLLAIPFEGGQSLYDLIVPNDINLARILYHAVAYMRRKFTLVIGLVVLQDTVYLLSELTKNCFVILRNTNRRLPCHVVLGLKTYYQDLVDRQVERDQFLVLAEVLAQFYSLDKLIASNQSALIICQLFVIALQQHQDLPVVPLSFLVGEVEQQGVALDLGRRVLFAEYFLHSADHVFYLLQTQAAVYAYLIHYLHLNPSEKTYT